MINKRLIVDGKEYWIYNNDTMNVRIPAGEPRVMKASVKAHWRSVKKGGATFNKVMRAAGVKVEA